MDIYNDRYQKKNRQLSFVKSGIRCGTLLAVLTPIASIDTDMVILCLGLLAAEIIGVWEEMI